MNIVQPKCEVWFLASCIEFYKDEKGLSGQETYDYLRRTNALNFIVDRWEGLHMTSPQYVIDSIDEFVKNETTLKKKTNNANS